MLGSLSDPTLVCHGLTHFLARGSHIRTSRTLNFLFKPLMFSLYTCKGSNIVCTIDGTFILY